MCEDVRPTPSEIDHYIVNSFNHTWISKHQRKIYAILTVVVYCIFYIIIYRGHDAAVLCVQFDDSKIVSGSCDKTIKVNKTIKPKQRIKLNT